MYFTNCAYKQTHRSVEKNRNPRHKLTYMVNKLTTKEPRIYSGERLCVLSHFTCVPLFVILWVVAHQDPLSLGFSGKNTGMGCHALLQRIFLTQEVNPSLLHLLHCRWVLYLLSPWGSPFSKNGARKTGQPQTQEWNCTTTLHHIQKSTENGLKLQHKT